MTKPDRYILTITCPDTIGLVAAVSGFLRDQSCFIDESAQFGDPSTMRFFMRAVFTRGANSTDITSIKSAFSRVAHPFAMQWQMVSWHDKSRIVIAVSKFGHCLNDLLHRWKAGQLAVDVAAVVSNHDDMRSLVEWHGIPYHFSPVGPAGKAEQERKLLTVVEQTEAELLVLARYMQVLSPEACAKLAGRCINIHHSFLPSFKGARPYQQAFDRGVKIIGATAHYTTANLDEGPIIDQAVERVDHTHSAASLVAVGRDLENVVLARAVRYHAERRVLVNGSKTVVFK
ncbi:MAG: formyltetrahydrofolate deformylase [Rhodospirillaceae bacterium]|nr:formyltetrahydrofolate deformylase [Rhodospirillaceae bacterium]